MHPENRSPGELGNKGAQKIHAASRKPCKCDRYMSETKIPEMLRGAGREDPNVSGLTLTHDRPVQMNL
jgi:hypothetical protein